MSTSSLKVPITRLVSQPYRQSDPSISDNYSPLVSGQVACIDSLIKCQVSPSLSII